MTNEPQRIPNLPVPVILANHPLKRFWPRSSPERPWCFRRGAQAQSPLEYLLESFCSDSRFAPPLVVCSDSSIRAASEQTAPWRERGVKMMTVPQDTRNGTAAAMAAIELSATSSRRGLLFIPATMIATDGENLPDLLARSIATLADPSAVLVQTRSNRPGDSGIAFDPSHSFQGGRLLSVAGIRTLDTDELDPALSGTPGLQVPVGTFFCQAPVLMDALKEAAPVLLKSAVTALQLAERTGSVIHPHSGFLSLSTGYSAAEFLLAGKARILLQPVGNRLKSLNGWADTDPRDDDGASPMPIHAAGVSGCRIIQGAGGVFIAAPGHEHEAENHYRRPGEIETGRTAKLRMRQWGAEQLVEEDYGIKMLRLEIDPGGVLMPECHFRRHETWTVSSGQGVAVIDQRIQVVGPGDLLTIPRAAIHSLRNTGLEPLIIYEVRSGNYLEDDDRVRTEPATQPSVQESLLQA